MECVIIRTGLSALTLVGSAGVLLALATCGRDAPVRSPEPGTSTAYKTGFVGPAASLLAQTAQEAPQQRRGPRSGIGSGQEPPVDYLAPKPYHEFYFTRAVYSGGMRRWGGSWAIDFPKADRQFLYVIGRTLELLDVYQWENPVRLDDPALLDFPFLYALEVGRMNLTEPEAVGLRDYLERGGFLVIDDFWGTRQWDVFESEIRKVFPDRPIVELTPEHELFNVFYEINEIIQVPSVANAQRGGPTWEQDGYEAHVRGIFDDHGRLMVVINWNTDLGDAWEWSENPAYPFEFSNFAHKLGVNFIIYSMTH